jgi:branched-chain amino acid transport system permease protein
MTYIGGVAFFIGPIIGAVVMTALQVSLSDYTGAWQMYVGLMFIVVVMYAPGGLAGLLLMHRPLLRTGMLARVLPSYALAAVPALALFAGAVLLIETSHHLLVKAAEGPKMHALWISYDATSPAAWAGIAALLAIGFFAFRRTWPVVSHAWNEAATEARRRLGQ